MIIDKVDGCIEDKKGDKYITPVSTNENKEGLQITQNVGIKLNIPWKKKKWKTTWNEKNFMKI